MKFCNVGIYLDFISMSLAIGLYKLELSKRVIDEGMNISKSIELL